MLVTRQKYSQDLIEVKSCAGISIEGFMMPGMRVKVLISEFQIHFKICNRCVAILGLYAPFKNNILESVVFTFRYCNKVITSSHC